MTATTNTQQRPTSNAALVKRLDALESRVVELEGVLMQARDRQQQAAAAKLSQDPEKLAALKALVEMAGG